VKTIIVKSVEYVVNPTDEYGDITDPIFFNNVAEARGEFLALKGAGFLERVTRRTEFVKTDYLENGANAAPVDDNDIERETIETKEA